MCGIGRHLLGDQGEGGIGSYGSVVGKAPAIGNAAAEATRRLVELGLKAKAK